MKAKRKHAKKVKKKIAKARREPGAAFMKPLTTGSALKEATGFFNPFFIA